MSEKIAKNLTQEYWDKLLDDNFSLKGVGWPNWPESYNLILYKKYLKGFEKVTNNLKSVYNFNFENDTKVFEVGAGTGFYTNYFNQLGVKNYTGIDISEISIKNLKKKYPDYTFFRKDISIDDDFVITHMKYFDLICIVDVLLHITDDGKFRNSVTNICKMLKQGGYLIIGDPISIYRLKSHSEGSKYTHDVSRNINYIKEIFSNSNTEVIGIFQRYNFLLNKNFDFKHPFFEKLFNIFFFFLNGGLSFFWNSNFIGYMVGIPLSLLDSVITPLQKYSKNSKFILFHKPS